MKRICIIGLLIISLTSCNKGVTEAPKYTEVLQGRYNNTLEEHTSLVDEVKKYEINVIVDYITDGVEVMHSRYSTLEEASDTDGSVDLSINLPEPLGAYQKASLETLMGFTVQESLNYLNAEYEKRENNVNSFTKAYIVACDIEINYTYDEDTKLLDQSIIMYDWLENEHMVVLTWNKEGCVNVEGQIINIFD